MQQAQGPTSAVRLISAETAAALRFAFAAAAAGVALLALAAVWMSTCTGGTGGDTAACGPVPATALGLAAPIVLLTAAAWAFWRGVRRGAAWHGAGAVLLILTAVTLIPG